MTLLYFLVVILRYAFNWGSVAMQESVTYLNAAMFMLAAAAGLAQGSHVRVDLFYGRWPARRKALVDALGALLFLLPFAAFLFAVSLGYVGAAWRLRETSTDPGGLPLIWLLKTLIPVMAVQLMLQALASAVLNLAAWRKGVPA
ncbi:MAG: TRAP transporter small permease subunit [Gammaproteobacteria bacterium]|nr:TRAP transporter small permease subunit [Gammaproteobacteria bacterium]